MHENAAPPRGRASRPGEKIGQLQLLVLTIATHLACVDIRMMEAGFLRIRGMCSSSRAWFAATAVQELREMPLIVFPGKELQASSPYCRMPQAIRTPGNSLTTPRKISEKRQPAGKSLAQYLSAAQCAKASCSNQDRE